MLSRSIGGSALVEVLVALGIFVILAATGISALSLTLNSDQISYDRLRASQLASEGLEVAQQIQRSDWNSLTGGTHGLIWTGYGWNLQGSSDQQGKFQRAVTIAAVNRDGGDNITPSGTPDPDTKKVTSTISWPASPVRTESISYTTYLTNFFAPVPNTIGNWALPLEHLNLDLTGTHDAYHITISGNYLYLTRVSTLPNFMILDISNPLNPTVVGSIATNLAGNLRQVAVWGNYAYVASTDDTSEIHVVDITNKNNPVRINGLNVPGNQDMFAMEIKNNNLFAGRSNSLWIFSLSTPSAGAGNHGLTHLNNSPLTITSSINDIQITDNTLCFATTSTSGEVGCTNISNPALPSTPLVLNLTGNAIGYSLDRIGNTLLVGLSTNNLTAVNMTNFPTSITQISQFSTGGIVRSVSAITGSNYLLALTANTTKEIQVINVTNPASMVEHGFFNTTNTTSTYSTILYHSSADVGYATFATDNREVTVYKPTPF